MHFFVPSTVGTLAMEQKEATDTILRSLSATGQVNTPSGSRSPMIGEGLFRGPMTPTTTERSVPQRSRPRDGSESDSSVGGQATKSKIGGEHLLVADPQKWAIRESMKCGASWVVPALQKQVALTLSQVKGRMIGGSTASGTFKVHDIAPQIYRNGLFFNVELARDGVPWKTKFVTCDG